MTVPAEPGVRIVPDQFTKVEYDPAVLAQWASDALVRVFGTGRGSWAEVEVRIDENAATTRMTLAALDPVVIEADGGSVENRRDPRRLGRQEAEIAFTRTFLELYDRTLEVFGAPVLGQDLPQRHRAAWEANLCGRVSRLGVRLHQPRYRYDFRIRHGFTDRADAAFNRLWEAGDTTWARIVALSDQAAGVTVAS